MNASNPSASTARPISAPDSTGERSTGRPERPHAINLGIDPCLYPDNVSSLNSIAPNAHDGRRSDCCYEVCYSARPRQDASHPGEPDPPGPSSSVAKLTGSWPATCSISTPSP